MTRKAPASVRGCNTKKKEIHKAKATKIDKQKKRRKKKEYNPSCTSHLLVHVDVYQIYEAFPALLELLYLIFLELAGTEVVDGLRERGREVKSEWR